MMMFIPASGVLIGLLFISFPRHVQRFFGYPGGPPLLTRIVGAVFVLFWVFFLQFTRL